MKALRNHKTRMRRHLPIQGQDAVVAVGMQMVEAGKGAVGAVGVDPSSHLHKS